MQSLPKPGRTWATLIGAALLLTCAVAPATAADPAAAATDPAEMPDFLGETGPRAQLLLLGTFHFQDAGLDTHKPTHGFDATSEARQREIEAALDMLAAWKPTRIAVEVRSDRQAELDASYAAFLAGEQELSPREVHQIAFRLGKRLGHDRLHAVDAERRHYEPELTGEEYRARVAKLMEGVDPARVAAEQAKDAAFMKMYDWEDAQLDRTTLAEHWRFLNHPETLRRHHGHYLIGSFKLGRGDDFFGPDRATSWYNRNLRIFHNLTRIPGGPGERVLLLIGAGHVPILRHATLASPDFALVEVADVIAASGAAAPQEGDPPPPPAPVRIDTRE